MNELEMIAEMLEKDMQTNPSKETQAKLDRVYDRLAAEALI